jgi:hypothetical protein
MVYHSTSLFRKVMSCPRDSWALVKRPDPLLDLLVGNCDAFVLPQMFYPRLDQKLLPVLASRRRVAEQPPRKGAVAAPNRFQFLHIGRKLRGAGRIDLILDDHQHRLEL